MKTWYVVVSSFYNNGRVTCNLVDSVEATEQPPQGFASNRRCDVYVDYFDTLEAARAFIEQSRLA